MMPINDWPIIELSVTEAAHLQKAHWRVTLLAQ